MTNKIQGVERDVVLVPLYTRKTNLIINSSKDTPGIIPTTSYATPNQNFLFIPQNVFLSTLPHFTENSEITVCFFYQGRGIFFKSKPQPTMYGYGMMIPQVLYKQQDKNPETIYEVTGKIFYTEKEENGRYISCVSNPNFHLFTPYLWHYFSENDVCKSYEFLKKIAKIDICEKNKEMESIFVKDSKILYLPEGKIPSKNYFPYAATFTTEELTMFPAFMDKEVYIPFLDKSKGDTMPHSVGYIIQDSVILSPLDIEDAISMLPICKFFSMNQNEFSSIQGRAVPLEILFINSNFLIIGLKEGVFPLQKGSEYPISLYIRLPIGKREVFVNVYISRIFESTNYISSKQTSIEKNKTVALCRYTSIKEEDRRFLFEKLNKTIYN